MDQSDLVTVYTASNAMLAEIVKNFLQSEGIRAFIEGENQAAEAGLMGLEISVQAPAAQADRARKLIAEHEPHKRQS